MKPFDEISAELYTISPLLAGAERINPFSLPDGYFNLFPGILLQKINNGPAGSLPGFEKYSQSVPDGYFENLSTSILNRIRHISIAEELKDVSSMLYPVRNENVFSVPEGYFNDLASEIIEKAKPKAKVIPFKKKEPVWRYAVAAVMTGVIGVSSLMVFNRSQSVNESAISSYIQAASEYKNDQQINDGISKVPDEAIIKYLENTGTETDNEVLTSGFEENDLPAQKDYLQDSKTLDNYLDK